MKIKLHLQSNFWAGNDACNSHSKEWKQQVGKEMAEEKYVVFQLGKELYGVPIDRVERILEDQEITRIPKLASLFLGVFDLRGETIPALDLRKRFDLEQRAAPGSMIVVLSNDNRCAWRVDQVAGIYSFSDEDIQESPALVKAEKDEFLAGVGRHGNDLIVLLDADKVLPEKAKKALALAA